MKPSTKPLTSQLFIALLFSPILVPCSMRCVSAATEIAYDDGIPETTSSLDIGLHLAVRFSLPSGLPSARLLMCRIYKAGRSGVGMRVHVLGSDGTTELTSSFNFSLAAESAWNNADVAARNIIVSDVFYVTVEYLMYYDPLIGGDSTDPKSRSYYGYPGFWSLIDKGENVMIRAVIDPSVTVSSMVTKMLPAENLLGASGPYVYFVSAVTMMAMALVVWKRRTFNRRSVSR